MTGRRGRPGRVLLIALLSVLALNGCGPATRGKLLRAFFDGVPDGSGKTADAVKDARPEGKTEGPESGTKKQAGPATFFHPPFLEGMCDSCHDSTSSQKLIYNGKELCFTCHDDFTKDKKVVHYPVEADECLECHQPHQSDNERLLKKKVPQMCYECHDEKETRDLPAHQGKEKCLECHDPHASGLEKLLK
ncbi:MAG: hypothetical protein HYT89_06325 [Candidatus Omnitrophica bacterium]|nr:hypothetical protein [Candidatus Omnitrophota bacterium]